MVLIEKFFEENNDVLETTFDLDGSDEKVPIGTEIPDNIETDEQLMSYISSVSDIEPNILMAKFYKKYFLPTTKKEVDEFLSNMGEIKYVTVKEGKGYKSEKITRFDLIAGKSYPVIREVEANKSVPEGQFEIIDPYSYKKGSFSTRPVVLSKSRFVGFDDKVPTGNEIPNSVQSNDMLSREEIDKIEEKYGANSDEYSSITLPKNFNWKKADRISLNDPNTFTMEANDWLNDNGYDVQKYGLVPSSEYGKNPKLLKEVFAVDDESYFQLLYLYERTDETNKLDEEYDEFNPYNINYTGEIKENPISKKIKAFELLLQVSTDQEKKIIRDKIKAFKLIENL